MTQHLHIRNIHSHSFHGCLKEEKVIGGSFTTHVSFEGDFSKAVTSDRLEDAVDYVLVHRIVREEMAVPSALIEHVAGRILDRMRSAFPAVTTITVEVIKYNPPVNGQLGEASFVIKG